MVYAETPSPPVGGTTPSTTGSAIRGLTIVVVPGESVSTNVGGDNVVDFTALGDPVNTASRLASLAGAGEALLSETVYASVKREFPNLESRTLSLRGKEAPVDVRVLHPSAA